MLNYSGKRTGRPIEPLRMMVMPTTAKSTSLTTGSVPRDANTLGSAEVLDPAREEDFAQDGMLALRLHFLNRLQDSFQTTDQYTHYQCSVRLIFKNLIIR